MIGGIKAQNKALSDAGSRPKDTSYRVDGALKYSAKVTSTPQGDAIPENSRANVVMQKRGASKIQGSYAGLMDGKSAYLQPNDVGYDAKKHQQARYAQKVSSFDGSGLNLGSLINNKNYSIMNNYSNNTMKDSSSDRLNSIVRDNMMFK